MGFGQLPFTYLFSFFTGQNDLQSLIWNLSCIQDIGQVKEYLSVAQPDNWYGTSDWRHAVCGPAQCAQHPLTEAHEGLHSLTRF